MSTYKIEHTSVWLNLITVFIVSFILFIVSIIMVFLKAFDGDYYWLPPFFVFPLTIAGFIAVNVFGTFNVEISVTDAGLNIEKQKKFLSSFSSIFIEWKDIKSYFVDKEGIFQVFKLKTVSGKKIKMTHSKYATDDFEIFTNHFLTKVNEVNAAMPYADPITATKTIY